MRIVESCVVLSALGVALACREMPQASPAILPSELAAHVRFLASDVLEGRATASRGGRITEEYIATELESYGVLPGVEGSYYQPVPIDIIDADPATMHITVSGKATRPLRYREDVAIWAGSATPSSIAKGELVFVGYGITAPEEKWDDFKGADVKGKILLVLVNDPPAPPSEPSLFGGFAETWYGRWVYKFDEAERRGAAGALVIHNAPDAGGAWTSFVGTFATSHRMLPRDPAAPPPLGVRGWIQNDVAASLLKEAGLDLEQLRRMAATREFKPVPTGIALDIGFTNSVQHEQANNVVGVIPGSDPALRSQFVSYGAHWDHMGIGPPVNGDSIYNGAVDNASGVALILAVARASAEAPVKPARSQLFVFYTAEESGLLGSGYYAEHPTVATRDIIANLNAEMIYPFGKVHDLVALGATKSSLGPSLAAFVKPLGMTVSPELHPEVGEFYRSDHFPMAKAGIPAISISLGANYVGRPTGWGKQQEDEFTAKKYHWPADEYASKWDLTGAAQAANIFLGFGQSLANGSELPTWNADAEFKAAREKAMASR